MKIIVFTSLSRPLLKSWCSLLLREALVRALAVTIVKRQDRHANLEVMLKHLIHVLNVDVSRIPDIDNVDLWIDQVVPKLKIKEQDLLMVRLCDILVFLLSLSHLLIATDFFYKEVRFWGHWLDPSISVYFHLHSSLMVTLRFQRSYCYSVHCALRECIPNSTDSRSAKKSSVT